MNDPTSVVPAVSAGPFDERPTDELRQAIAPDAGVPQDWHERRVQWLLDQLERAGVETWSHDHAVAEYLAMYDGPLAQVVAGWVARATGATP